MSITTTLYDLIEVVSAECNDGNQVVPIDQDLINSGKVVLVRSSSRVQVVSLVAKQGEHWFSVYRNKDSREEVMLMTTGK